ncbi:MAG: sulfite exporter TauE/SafE family protein [Kofleriaceae bacterium]|nr:sulfite exporter TauE/SafE family protein [Kofleriaceae bacterium]
MDLVLHVGGVEVSLLVVIALGVTVGIVAGMFGVGGGFLLIPLLHVVLDLPLAIAIGTGLCQTIATSLGSFLRHRAMGNAESRFDILLLGGSVVGVLLGGLLLESLSHMGSVALFGKEIPLIRVIVTAVFLLLFCTIAVMLWFKNTPILATPQPGPLARIRIPPYVNLPTAKLPQVSAFSICYLGVFIGVITGLLGSGGGIILIPLMLYGFGFDIRTAAGTGIIVVLIVSIVGTVQQAMMGNVHLGLATTLMIGSALAAQVGAGLTRSLPPTFLRKGLALTILVSNCALVVKVLR